MAEQLRAAGIPTAIHYPQPIHRQPAYEGRCRIAGSLANAETAAAQVLSLPMHPDLPPPDQDGIVAAVRAATGTAMKAATD